MSSDATRRAPGTLAALALALALATATIGPTLTPAAHADASYVNPVISVDFPDPSVIRVGSDYWATATSGQWAPSFELEHSTDLVNWTAVGALFDRPPAWTAGAYWAPALSFAQGTFRAYYAARRRGGKPCIGMATAPAGAGPYHNVGPILCPPQGAIDPEIFATARRQVLLYKRMGVGGPVRIVPLSGDGTRVTGRGVAVLRPTRGWEGGVTENPYLVKRPDGYYLFYSGGHCCRPPCTYATGVARSRGLLGPYVKAAAPVLRGNASWMCPGGASVVTDPSGQSYLAYHAYVRGDPSRGRQMLLDQISWGADGWPVVAAGQGPSVLASSALAGAQQGMGAFVDSFSERALGPGWQWPFDRRPTFALRGALSLSLVPGDETATFLGRVAPWPAYIATTRLDTRALAPGVTASLALLRAEDGRTLGIGVSARGIDVWRRQDGRRATAFAAPRPPSDRLWLRWVLPGDDTATPQVSRDGAAWTALGAPLELAQGFDPARVVLAGRGPRAAIARFDLLRIEPYAP